MAATVLLDYMHSSALFSTKIPSKLRITGKKTGTTCSQRKRFLF